jgi:excinuclease ABC, C subunit
MDIKKIDIPLNPGVYMMKDKNGEIIYIGKAKNLKNRVSSYFTGTHNTKTMELVKNIENIDFFICNTELEAFILENNLIKKHKPKYNILLKDQKTYPYLKITKEEFPRILVVRRVSDDAYYFGPFPNVNMKEVVMNLKKVFKLKDTKVKVVNKDGKEYIDYHIDLSNGPSFFKKPEIKEEYQENVRQLLLFLNSKKTDVLKYLEERMEKFSENLEFEKAIIERERIKALKKLLAYQITESTRENDEDIVTIDKNDKKLFICILSIRNGKLISKTSKVIDILVDNDLIDSVIARYYEKILAPKTVVLDEMYEDKKDILEGWFKTEKNKNVKVVFPKKGRLHNLLKLANLNLENEKSRYFNEKRKLNAILEDLKEMLDLPKYPRIIESYDISNIQGADSVAGQVVFVNGKKQTKMYKKYKIKTVVGPDDYHSMKEVILRRLNHPPYPDLILLDGGKTHVGVIRKTLAKENIDIPVFGMYKNNKHRTYGLCDDERVYDLKGNEKLFNLITSFQDEVHRFSITYHKLLRSKRVLKSRLDEIEGIGPKRKKELLKNFKTVDNVFNASVDELKKYVPEKIAKAISEN